MKKIIIIMCVAGIVAILEAKLRIRQEHPAWRDEEIGCCVNRRSAVVPYSVDDAEDAVVALQDEINRKYDSGIYQADKMMGWQKDRNRMLEIQSQLGFTPDDDTFDSSYDDTF